MENTKSRLGLDTLAEGATPVLSGDVPAPEAGLFYTPPASGAKPKFLGYIQACHLAELSFAKPIAPVVAAMGAKFHEIARLISSGLEVVEVARRLGINYEVLQLLVEAPSFKMVLAQHQKQRDAAFADLTRQINLVAEDALALLHIRIIQGKISDKELVKSVMSLLNIDGYSGVQKHLIASGSLDEIARAKRAALEANRDRVHRAGPTKALPTDLDSTYELLALEAPKAA